MNGSKPIQGCKLHFLALFASALLLSACGDGADSLLAKAKAEQAKGQDKAAMIYLKDLLQKSPEHAEGRYLLGMAYNRTGDFNSAEAEFRRALDMRYDPVQIMPALGKSLLMMGQFQKVLDQVKQEGDSGGQWQAEILTLRAQALIGLGRVDEGRELLQQALAKKPGYVDALLAQARIAANGKDIDEAMRLIEQTLASAPKDVEAWMMKGDILRLKTDTAGATAAYQKVAEINPENILSRINIASILVDAGSLDDAMKQIEEVRKLAPSNPIASYMQALIEFRKKNLAASRNTIQQVLKVLPGHMPSVLLAGSVEAALGSHVLAQSYLGKVVDSAPKYLYARRLLISSLMASGQAARALEVLQPGLEQAPEDSGLMTLAGQVYMQNNDFAHAAQYFEKAAKLDPKSADAKAGLGMSRMASGQTDRALADLESAVQLDSGKFQADIMLIMSHLQNAKFDLALKAVDSLEKKQADNPLTYNLKAAVFLGKKDTAGARKSLQRALELQPTYVPAAINLAQLDIQDKDQKSARRRFEVILEKDQNNVQALMALANLGSRLGATPKEVIEWLERARKASPGALQPQVMLARAYAQSGDPKKALEVAQAAQAASPDSAEALDLLGTLQMGSGAGEQARVTFGKLVALQPKSPVALYRLATAQAMGGNQTDAAESLKKALSLKGDYVDAQVGLGRLELRAGRYSAATKIAQQLQKQVAKSPLGFDLDGDVSMAEKKFSQAVKAYETAYGLEKSSGMAIKLHGALTQAGNTADADARLSQWMKQSPDDAALRLYSAELNLKAGRHKIAIEQYEWLRTKQPENVVVLNNLAWAYQQIKDPRALETAEGAFKLRPDNAAIADTLGWMLVEQGNTARGVEVLQKAVAAAPAAQEIRFHLAQALLKSGDKVKARAELERIQTNGTKFPQETEAMNMLKQLKN